MNATACNCLLCNSQLKSDATTPFEEYDAAPVVKNVSIGLTDRDSM